MWERITHIWPSIDHRIVESDIRKITISSQEFNHLPWFERFQCLLHVVPVFLTETPVRNLAFNQDIRPIRLYPSRTYTCKCVKDHIRRVENKWIMHYTMISNRWKESLMLKISNFEQTDPDFRGTCIAKEVRVGIHRIFASDTAVRETQLSIRFMSCRVITSH